MRGRWARAIRSTQSKEQEDGGLGVYVSHGDEMVLVPIVSTGIIYVWVCLAWLGRAVAGCDLEEGWGRDMHGCHHLLHGCSGPTARDGDGRRDRMMMGFFFGWLSGGRNLQLRLCYR